MAVTVTVPETVPAAGAVMVTTGAVVSTGGAGVMVRLTVTAVDVASPSLAR